ncbi:SufD family Fe-S cluster assembly protein [Nitrosophilus kaiyonis]|uniref:SufD family Fe-S cluster assembly protein n=1 Tax=Nitrosophilus kaiyonis TaxID=2930200 RepID=UPI002491A986|nr:SufD family Fe-S cluster assembly protein [Nitrosophilus kaiyonis]
MKVALSKMDIGSILDLSNKEKTKTTSAVALSSLGVNFKKSEHYRYFNLFYLLSNEFEIYSPITSTIKEGDLIIEDGAIVSAPKDLKVNIVDEIDICKNHFDQIYYINHLLSQKIIKIDVDKDMVLNLKHIFLQNEKLLPYRINLNIKNGAKVTLYEDFEDRLNSGLIFYGWDINIEDKSYLEFIRVQDEFEKSYNMVASHFINVEDEAKFDIKSFDIGEGKICHNLKIDIHKDSICDAKHLVYTDNNAIRANNIKISHIKENAKTNQEARHVLKDRSTAIFDALIKVETKAKGAIAHQNNKSILLNDKAYMVSKPQLEIYIDELEASHGSTTGQIDPEELFYIRARGIRENEARKMIVLGFMKEVINSIKDEKKQNEIYKRFEEIYNRDTK